MDRSYDGCHRQNGLSGGFRQNGAVYYATQSVAVLDENLDTIIWNGTKIGASFTLAGDTEVIHRIIETDLAGNETNYTVTMKPISNPAVHLHDFSYLLFAMPEIGIPYLRKDLDQVTEVKHSVSTRFVYIYPGDSPFYEAKDRLPVLAHRAIPILWQS